MMKKNEKGFTLVEMAIVMVIGGMMIGAVMKGHAIIENFKARRLMTDVESISVAYLTYINRYNAVPGDESNNHGWPGVTGGNGDGWIDNGDPEDGNEAHEAWQALRRAGIITGNPNTTGIGQLPTSPYGGKYYLGNRDFGIGFGKRNYVRVNTLTGNIAESVDLRYDDGIYDSGSVRATEDYSSGNVDLFYAI